MSVSLPLVERHVSRTALLILKLSGSEHQLLPDHGRHFCDYTSWIVVAVLLCDENEYVIFNAVFLCFLIFLKSNMVLVPVHYIKHVTDLYPFMKYVSVKQLSFTYIMD